MRSSEDRGAAAVEAGLLVAGVATMLITATALMSEQIESLLRAALAAVSGG